MVEGFLDAAVVTGAGKGLGQSVARRLASLGLPVLCLSKSGNCHDTVAGIRGGGGCAEALPIELERPEEAGSIVSEWIFRKPFRRLGVVLAAGVLGEPGGISSMKTEDWTRTFTVNVLGNLAVLNALLPRMKEARFGRVVTLGGGGAAYAYPEFFGYSLSKVAMVRATENLHQELKDAGDFCTVCLAPGAMDTDMLRQVRAAGGYVKTTVAMEEPVRFIEKFLQAERCSFSGRFVHVRDNWSEYIDSNDTPDGNQWLLRRIET